MTWAASADGPSEQGGEQHAQKNVCGLRPGTDGGGRRARVGSDVHGSEPPCPTCGRTGRIAQPGGTSARKVDQTRAVSPSNRRVTGGGDQWQALRFPGTAAGIQAGGPRVRVRSCQRRVDAEEADATSGPPRGGHGGERKNVP